MDNIIDSSTFLKNKKTISEPSKRIMVIQLGYVKDLLMITPFLQELREKEKNAVIEVLVIEELREMIEGADFIDIINIISERIVNRMNEMILDKMDDFFNEPFSYNFINSLGDFDDVYNFCDAPFSSWICENLYSEEKKGSILINDGEFLYNSSWSTYVGGLPLYRDVNRFNMTDMFRGYIDGSYEKELKPLYISKVEYKELPEKKVPRIILSFDEPAKTAKRWSSEYVFKLAGLLVENGYQVVLFGEESDKNDADKIVREYGDRIIDLTNKITNSQKAWVAGNCDGMIVNSPHDGFIGAASNIPLVCVYSSDDAFDMVPYSENVLMLYLNKSNYMTATKFYHKIVFLGMQYMLGKISDSDFLNFDKDVFFKAYRTESFSGKLDGYGGIRVRDISGRVGIDNVGLYAEILRFSIAIGRSNKDYDTGLIQEIEGFLNERFEYDLNGIGEYLRTTEEFYKNIKWLEMDYRKLITSLKRRTKKSSSILRKIRGEDEQEKTINSNPEDIGIEIAKKEEMLDSLNMNKQFIRPAVGPMLWETRMILSVGEEFMNAAIAIYERYSVTLGIQIEIIKFIMEKYGINGTEKKRKTKKDTN